MEDNRPRETKGPSESESLLAKGEGRNLSEEK